MASAAQKKRLKSALNEARSRPNDPIAKAKVALAWIDQGKPEVALSWAVEATRLEPGEAQFKTLLERTSKMIQGLDQASNKPPKPTAKPQRTITKVRVWDEPTEVEDATIRAPAPELPRAWEEITEPQSKQSTIPTARLPVGAKSSESQFVIPDTVPIPKLSRRRAKPAVGVEASSSGGATAALSTLVVARSSSSMVSGRSIALGSESVPPLGQPTPGPRAPMAKLLCGSLFPNVRLDESRVIASKRGPSLKSVATLGALVGVAVILGLGVRTGIRAKTHRQVTIDVEDFRHQLSVGSLMSVAQTLPDLERKIEVAHAGGAHTQLAVLANATLYRYHDADPKRLKRVRAAILEEPKSAELQLAQALIHASVDRIGMIESLGAQKRSAEAQFLLATALERVGDFKKAETAYEQADTLEPAHLPRLVNSGWRLIDENNSNGALDLIDEMRDIDPLFVGIRVLEREMAPADKAGKMPASLSPVMRSQVVFRDALQRLNRKEEAIEQLKTALSKVYFQSAFALDYANTLLDRGYAEPARAVMRWVAERHPETVELSGWQALGARADLRLDKDPQSVAVLRRLLERGHPDPAVAVDYLNNIPRGALDESINTIAVQMMKRWPGHRALGAALAAHRAHPEAKKRRRKRRRRRRR